MFKHCNILPKNITRTNLKLFCCFSCKIENVTFIHYGIIGFNLIGKSHLNNIKVETMQFSKVCYMMILLEYSSCLPWNKYSNHVHDITINQLLIQNYITCNISTYTNAGLQIYLHNTKYHVNILLKNSKFYCMSTRPLMVKNSYSLTTSYVFIIDCIFELITAHRTIRIYVSPFNNTVIFINCIFHDNMGLIVITTVVCGAPNDYVLLTTNTIMSTKVMLTNISFVKCQFIGNRNSIINIDNIDPILSNLKANFLFESLIVLHNYLSAGVIPNTISINTMNVHINGTFNVTKNHCIQTIIHFQSCDILFSGKMMFIENTCKEVILMNTHIKVMEYMNISFIKNRCKIM